MRHGDVAQTLPQFHALTREAGRNPGSLPVTLFRAAGDLEQLRWYRDLGIARVVISLPAPGAMRSPRSSTAGRH